MFSQTMQFAVDWMNQCEMCVTRTLSTVDVNRPVKGYFWPTTEIKSTKTCVSKFMCIERLYYKKKNEQPCYMYRLLQFPKAGFTKHHYEEGVLSSLYSIFWLVRGDWSISLYPLPAIALTFDFCLKCRVQFQFWDCWGYLVCEGVE